MARTRGGRPLARKHTLQRWLPQRVQDSAEQQHPVINAGRWRRGLCSDQSCGGGVSPDAEVAHEPCEGHRREQKADFGGAEALQHEECNENATGNANNRRCKHHKAICQINCNSTQTDAQSQHYECMSRQVLRDCDRNSFAD